jgi:hypothetical protein
MRADSPRKMVGTMGSREYRPNVGDSLDFSKVRHQVCVNLGKPRRIPKVGRRMSWQS